mgnify:CR=1 FL=1
MTWDAIDVMFAVLVGLLLLLLSSFVAAIVVSMWVELIRNMRGPR